MTQVPFDPLALWRDMLSRWEAGFNQLAGKNMAPPEFMADLMGRYLTAMSMPSRADLAVLDERLRRIEDQLARLSAVMESGSGAPRGGRSSARAKRGAPAASPNGPTSAVVGEHAARSVAASGRKSPRRAAKKK